MAPIRSEPDNYIDGDTVCGDVNNSPVTANPDQADADDDGIGDACDQPVDQDGDGVLDARDWCPDTTYGDVVNRWGSSIGQICTCEHPMWGAKWKNHGAYVHHVAHTSRRFIRRDLITRFERRSILTEAVRSDCGKRH